ncbi:MAG: TIR domain-containing protein [Gammaproteobacteria bacterium]
MADIFLSYNREDQAIARRFADAFAAQSFEVWWDTTLRAGEAYDEVTETALRTAKAVVVLWSKKSVVSRWVRAEATLADRNRTLVPVMIEPCERPIMFELTQTADLSRWSGDASDRTWQGFLADVRQFVGAGGTAPNPQTSPHVPAAAIAGPPRSKDHRPSLAILPFTNRSGERADDVFSDGMVEDLISALSLSGGLKVIAQSATAVYRKNVSDLRSIGQELGVRYLLEGNVRRVGANLRVTVQLVEAETGAIVWAQKFDRPLTELADLQEQLVIDVAGHLGVQVERIEMEAALKKPGDLTAWEAVMRALAGFAKLTPDSMRAGIAEARKAVAIAPDYALGHAALAHELAGLFSTFDGGRDQALAREARTHAERALALDTDDPNVLTYAALALGWCGSWREALRYAQRAVDLNPNIAQCRTHLALVCIRFNRPDDAITHLDAVAMLAPRGYQAYLSIGYAGVAHFQAGRYEQALQLVEQALLMNPDFIYSLKDKAVICEKLGLHEEARDAVRRLRKVDRSTTLEQIEAANTLGFISPETAVDMNATLRKVWLDTPPESPEP